VVASKLASKGSELILIAAGEDWIVPFKLNAKITS
jgi:hypothetical protein